MSCLLNENESKSILHQQLLRGGCGGYVFICVCLFDGSITHKQLDGLDERMQPIKKTLNFDEDSIQWIDPGSLSLTLRDRTLSQEIIHGS